MGNLGSLVVMIEANLAKFTGEMERSAYIAEQNAKRIQKNLDGVTSGIKTMIGVAVGAVGLHKLFSTMKELGSEAKELEKAAQRLGMTVESLSGMQYVAKKNKVDVEAFNTGLVFMQKNLASAAAGQAASAGELDEFGEKTGKAGQALKDLGLNAKELISLSPQDQFLKIAKAMEQYTSHGDKLLLTTEIFGKSGAKLVNMLLEGEEGVRKFIAEGRNLGVILDKDMTGKMTQFSTASAKMDTSVRGLSMAFTTSLSPAIAGTVDQMTALVGMIGKVDPQILQLLLKVGGGAAVGYAFAGPKGAAVGAMAGLIHDAATLKAPAPSQNLPQLYPGMDLDIDPNAWLPGGGKRLDRRTAAGGGAGGGAKGGKSAKEEAQTVVDLFEQLSWGAEDADKALALCAERLTKMQDNQERLISGQAKYASEMAGLSPLLTTQLGYKEQALEKEHQLKLATLERELFEKKISRAVHDQELGMAALVNQAKKYSLEREKWATQGIGGGIKILQMEMAKESEVWVSKAFIEGFRGAQNFIENSLSGVLKGALRGEKTDLKKFGFAIADYTVDGMVKLAMRPLAKLFTGALQTAFTKVGGEALGAAFGDALGSIAGGVAGGVAGEAAGAAALSGAAALLSGSSLLLDGSSMLLDGSSLLLDGAAISLGIAADMLIFAAAMDAVPFFHSGGMVMHGGGPIYAHAGWPKLAHDERRIIAQTGERVLSRAQNRDYEAGGRGGGGTGNSYHFSMPVNHQVLQSLDRREIRRSARDLVRETEREMRRLGRG